MYRWKIPVTLSPPRRRLGIVIGALPFLALPSACLPPTDTSAEQFAESGAADPIARYLSAPLPAQRVEIEALAVVEEAMQRWRSGDRAAATRDIDQALAALPTLADWRPLVVAELLAATLDTAAVRAQLELLDPETEFMGRWGWQILAATFEDVRDFARAESVAASSAQSEIEPSRRAAKWLFAARMALARGDSVTAHTHLLDALAEGDAYAGARDAARLLDRMPFVLSPEQDRMVGRALVAAGSWEPAHLRLLPWLENGQLSPVERDELRALAGRSLVELRRFREAEALLAPLLRDGDSAYSVLAAYFWSGRSALAREDISLAESHFRSLARRAPSSPLAEEAFSLLLTREMESGFGPRSRGYLDELLQVDIRVPEIETLVVRLGTTLYLQGEYTAAARTFDQLIERSLRASARQQAAYWAGLSLDRVGDRGAARDRWRAAHDAEPFSFYGVLSAERIDAPLLAPDLRFGPAITPGSSVELGNALLRLRVHRLVPTVGSFNYELERLTGHFETFENGGYGFAEGLIEGGFPLQGVVLGRELVQAAGGWNLRLLRIVHPFPHREIIVREANARGLSPFFVAGVIRQESLFQPAVQSSSGAMGLMQLMPTTAREVAGTLGVTYSAEALVDPATNVRFGTTYLAAMLRRFDGRPEDALAAYNAGPTRARQWRDLPAYIDSAVFTEHIPFQETRSYVKLVQQYAWVYAALYGCGDFEPCLGLAPSGITAVASLPGDFGRVDSRGEM